MHGSKDVLESDLGRRSLKHVTLHTATAEWQVSWAAHTDEDPTLVHASKNGALWASGQRAQKYDSKLLRIAQKNAHDLGDEQQVVHEPLKAYQKLGSAAGN